ncbi:DUF1700 domain-containing protein [Clostridium sp. HBUAS56017]|uniref:DUF1700 domain-containing protein n=1 Tax=Clostridium sp. HBUAS56017 TaxID=2571128 RepID=UPI00163DA912|nr:DUF1700 domain-containing protein [Clostridium sp. HBUAS56017]
MNKNEFFKILKEGLNDFPEKELQDILYDYEEHFSNAKADGKSDEEIIKELGDPYVIVNQYRSGYVQGIPKSTYNKSNSSNSTKNTSNNSNSSNTILKIAIVILAFILFNSFILGATGAGLGILLTIIILPFSLLIGCIGLLLGKLGLGILGVSIPAFLADLPLSVVILVTIGSLAFTIFSIIVLIYVLKLIILAIRKLINKFSSKEDNR